MIVCFAGIPICFADLLLRSLDPIIIMSFASHKHTHPAQTHTPHQKSNPPAVALQALLIITSSPRCRGITRRAMRRYVYVNVYVCALVATFWGTAQALECTSSMDCALSGDCVDSKCVCDVGWQNPTKPTDPNWYPPSEDTSTTYGTPCSQFDLLPADPAMPGYQNDSWPSWGGHPVHWGKVPM
jgi:hypothetical protein